MPDKRLTSRPVPGSPAGRRAAPDRTHLRMTSAADRREHRVAEDAYVAAITARTGRAEAACGHLVVLASLASPPGGACRRCTEAVPDERTW